MGGERKQNILPETEIVMLLLVIRTGHWISPSYFLATGRKQSWVAHSDTLWRSLIKSRQSMQSPEWISTERKLPFCGHRCLMDCGTEREMNVKSSMMPLASIYCFRVQMSRHQCWCFWRFILCLRLFSARVRSCRRVLSVHSWRGWEVILLTGF